MYAPSAFEQGRELSPPLSFQDSLACLSSLFQRGGSSLLTAPDPQGLRGQEKTAAPSGSGSTEGLGRGSPTPTISAAVEGLALALPSSRRLTYLRHQGVTC